eukprot:Em0016g706a
MLNHFACLLVICLVQSTAARSIPQDIEVEAADDNEMLENRYEEYTQGYANRLFRKWKTATQTMRDPSATRKWFSPMTWV